MDYLALRRHIEVEHRGKPYLYLGLRNDVLAERHAFVCDWPDDGLFDHCGCCAHARRSGCGGANCPCSPFRAPETTEPGGPME